jgi:hypothetical protein
VAGNAFNTFFSENKQKLAEGHYGNPSVQLVFMEEKIGFLREDC